MEERHYRTWEEWIEGNAVERPQDRDMLEWLHEPIGEKLARWAEEEYQEWRTVRRKRRKEKRRK
jgi:hypothetical protein